MKVEVLANKNSEWDSRKPYDMNRFILWLVILFHSVSFTLILVPYCFSDSWDIFSTHFNLSYWKSC